MAQDLTARLREVLRGTARPGPVPAITNEGSTPGAAGEEGMTRQARAAQAAAALGGIVVDGEIGPCVCVDRRFEGDHGRVSIGQAGAAIQALAPRASLLWRPAGDQPGDMRLGGSEAAPGRLLFFDLETTGLSGGAGTHAFLVGCGWFEGEAFVTRQFFLASFGAERALLELVRGLVAQAGVLVTFNGKTFDVPLIETRYAVQRLPCPVSVLPHVDLLHPARRLWRGHPSGDTLTRRDALAKAGQAAGCSLGTLESRLLAVRRSDDIPGADIPARYFQYVRDGHAEPLEPVLSHNRSDLLSLALLTARVLRLLERGAGAAADAGECFGLARLFERVGEEAAAHTCYARLAGDQGERFRRVGNGVHAHAIRALAVADRRAGRHDGAASRWAHLLALAGCPPELADEAREALAIHHEHRSRDLEAAQRYAEQLGTARSADRGGEAVAHRLARLARKRADREHPGLDAAAALFRR